MSASDGIATRVGENLLMDFAHQAAVLLEAAGELFDELPETLPTLRHRRFLMRSGDWCGDGQRMADEQRHRLDQYGLVAFDPFILPAKPVEPRCKRGLPLVAAIGKIGRAPCRERVCKYV